MGRGCCLGFGFDVFCFVAPPGVGMAEKAWPNSHLPNLIFSFFLVFLDFQLILWIYNSVTFMMDWILTYLWHGGSGIGPFSADPVYFWGNHVENDADSMPNLLQTANGSSQNTPNDAEWRVFNPPDLSQAILDPIPSLMVHRWPDSLRLIPETPPIHS